MFILLIGEAPRYGGMHHHISEADGGNHCEAIPQRFPVGIDLRFADPYHQGGKQHEGHKARHDLIRPGMFQNPAYQSELSHGLFPCALRFNDVEIAVDGRHVLHQPGGHGVIALDGHLGDHVGVAVHQREQLEPGAGQRAIACNSPSEKT